MASGQSGGFSLSSLLDQYESKGVDLSSGQNDKASKPVENIRNDGRRNGDSSSIRKERPATLNIRDKNGTETDKKPSPLTTFTPPISKALDAAENSDGAEAKKRKLEGASGTEGAGAPAAKKSRFEGMTPEQKAAEIKRLKALKAAKLAKEAAKANGGVVAKDNNIRSTSLPSNPNSPVTAEAPKKPTKGSYAEIMERAKALQATAAPPAKIVHVPKKVERRKIGKPDPVIKGKSAASKTQSLSTSAPSKISSAKAAAKPGISRSPVKPAAPPKPKIETIEWKGTARPSNPPKATASSSKSSARPSERDRDRDRDRERPRERDRDRDRDRDYYREDRYRSPVKTYRYVDSDDEEDYESESDMEATGFDILEEEEFSRKRGYKEDLEAEKLEKELAARKAAQKKGRY